MSSRCAGMSWRAVSARRVTTSGPSSLQASHKRMQCGKLMRSRRSVRSPQAMRPGQYDCRITFFLPMSQKRLVDYIKSTMKRECNVLPRHCGSSDTHAQHPITSSHRRDETTETRSAHRFHRSGIDVSSDWEGSAPHDEELFGASWKRIRSEKRMQGSHEVGGRRENRETHGRMTLSCSRPSTGSFLLRSSKDRRLLDHALRTNSRRPGETSSHTCYRGSNDCMRGLAFVKKR